MSDERSPILSIVLPVYNDRERAERCISSMLALEGLSEAAEIIVVDNGSSDGLDRMSAGQPVRFVEERRPGSYAARNHGAACARGEILAFTDSDCELDPGWGKAVIQAFEQPDLAAVQGVTTGIPGPTVWSAHVARHYRETLSRIGRDGLNRADTRNFAVRARIFRELEGFRDRWPHAADWEFGARLHHHGHRIELVEEMRAYHHDPVRLSNILRTRQRQAACMAMMHDRYSYLGRDRAFASLDRWYHTGRRIPVLRTILHHGFSAAADLTAWWMRCFHHRSAGEAGYRLFLVADTLSGVSGIYRPDRVLSGGRRA